MRKAAPRRRLEFYLGLWTLLFIAGMAVLVLFQPFAARRQTAAPSLELRASGVEGRVRVDWDPENQAVRTAQGGTLEVLDGGVHNRYAVEPQVLRSGTFDYVRKSDDVVLTLTLFHDSKPSGQGVVRTIGPVQTASASLTTPSKQQTRSRGRRR